MAFLQFVSTACIEKNLALFLITITSTSVTRKQMIWSMLMSDSNRRSSIWLEPIDL